MHSVTLPQAVTRDWPTPAVFDTTGGPYPTELTPDGFRSYHNGVPHGTKLSDAVRVEPQRSGPPRTASGPPDPVSGSTTGSPAASSWATPQSRDYRTSEGSEDRWANPERSRNLNDQTKAVQGSGKLNPSWVETLMGLPIGWTQLPHKFVKPKRGTP